MRDILYLVLHCTAGSPKQKTSDILHYWKNTLKWKSVGYHYLISADGTIEQLADESQITNGVAGFNKVSIHISYKGGVENGKPKDTRTFSQKASMLSLLKDLRKKYPKAIIQGHRDFGAKKACPSFDAKSEFKHI
jgi:N-acetylmuramoyl-L-alanine amidase